jgi:hypothetical protein
LIFPPFPLRFGGSRLIACYHACMPAVTASVTLRLPERLLVRVDEAAAAGFVSRNAWLVATLYSVLESGAAEQALEFEHRFIAEKDVVKLRERSDESTSVEQPEEPYVFEAERQAVRGAVDDGASQVRVEMGSALPRREFRPYPKGGK